MSAGKVPYTGRFAVSDMPKTHQYFVQRVLDTRNYLAHYSESLETGALHGPALSETVDEPRRVLAVFLLRELVLHEGKVVAAIRDIPRHGYFLLEYEYLSIHQEVA